MASFRRNFRDLKEWQDSTCGNIVLNTQSDEAAKMLDACFEQYCGWYDDESIGGFKTTINRLIEADPNFVLARAYELQFALLGGLCTPRLDISLAKQIEELNNLAEKYRKSITEHEKLHVSLVNQLAGNKLKEARSTLEIIATMYPHDVAALKSNQSLYFYLGQSFPMRASLVFALKKLEGSRNPYKGYLHGLMSFAFEESHQFDLAQSEALKAIALIPHDTWAIHNYAHCLEMQAKTTEGLKWMYNKEADWSKCQGLLSHQYWHTALFHINNNQFEDAVGLLDSQVLKSCEGNVNALNLHDATSMMYRMELSKLFAKTAPSNDNQCNHWRWKPVYDICKQHAKDHLIGFNDAHLLMAFLGVDDLRGARELIDSIDEQQPDVMPVANTVVKPLLEAMYSFKLGDYAKSAGALHDIRSDIVMIGGSHAQRDVFEQLLLVSALRSDKREHNQLAERMIAERDFMQNRRTVQTQLLAESVA